MEELARLIGQQGPLGLGFAVMLFLWVQSTRRYDAILHDYMQHLQDDIRDSREIRGKGHVESAA